jgi:predicted nucleotidyltransferase
MASNLALLEDAARKLEPLLDEVVFDGGATLDLLITDHGAAPTRSTFDVDVIVEITTYPDYVLFSDRLRILGFSENVRPGAPLCRWLHGDLTLDVMPLDAGVLGFSNRWYRDALNAAQPVRLPSGVTIRVITAPFFLGTKMEAFRGRGRRDFVASHDLEDFISVLDGRETILGEVALAPVNLRAYLAHAAKELLAEPRFRDALPGFLPGDAISQQRVPLLLRQMQELAMGSRS